MASSSSPASSLPGTTRTPAALTVRFAEILSPIATIAATGGPTKTIPFAAQARASVGFSDRNPYPGWIASAPVARAAAMTRSTSR